MSYHIFLILTVTFKVSSASSILALYDLDTGVGEAQLSGYHAAVQQWNSTSIEITYKPSKCGIVEHRAVLDFTQESQNEFVLVGGCCDTIFCQNIHSQVVYSTSLSSQPPSSQYNIRPDISSTFSALLELSRHQSWGQVLIIQDGASYQEMSEWLASILANAAFQVSVATSGTIEKSVGDIETDVVVSFSPQVACDFSGRSPVVLLSSETQKSLPCIKNIVILSPLENSDLQYAQEKLYSHDALTLVLQALTDRVQPMYLTDILKQSTYTGLNTGDIATDPLTGQRKFSIVINQLARRDGVETIGIYNKMTGLNLTDEITSVMVEEEELPGDNAVELSLLIIMSSLSFLTIIYTIAMIAFNLSKREDRIIKLTSPIINFISCVGCLLVLLSIAPLGIERPITSDLDIISRVKQGSIFALSLGSTIVTSSILVKTWRVHHIFKKMHVSNKTTKDVHLLAMISIMVFIDIAINIAWVEMDHLFCYFLKIPNAQERMRDQLYCTSQYLMVWSCILLGYKLMLVFGTLFYAWQVRNVKLPSLRDTWSIFAHTWVLCTLLVTTLPVILSSDTSYTIRYSVQSLAIIISVISTVTLLLLPKVLLLRRLQRKEDTDQKQESAVKFLFSASLQKSRDRNGCFSCFKGSQNGSNYGDEIDAGCFSCAKGSQAGSTIGDSVLAQEIDHLKQLVKEKEDIIRQLNDRLFFGTNQFQAYVQEKQTSQLPEHTYPPGTTNTNRKRQRQHARASQQSSVVSSVPTETTIVGPYHSHNALHPLNNAAHSPQISVISDAGYVDGLDFAYLSDDSEEVKPARSQPNQQLTFRQMTLPPIHEQSTYSGDTRCATPTTDSAINMSPSSSDREEECSSQTVQDIMNHVKRLMVNTQGVVGQEVTVDLKLPSGVNNQAYTSDV